MIKAKVFWQGKQLVGFDIKGHANQAPFGEDIVCSAISVLAITTTNSLLEQVGQVLVKSDDGLVSVKLPDGLDEEQKLKAQVILKTLLIGLNGVSLEYPKYVSLKNIVN